MAKKNLIILIILFLSIAIRLYWVLPLSLGLNSQEALLGYRAKLLLTTGKDETARRWPIVFTSFYDYQLPLMTYLVLPSVGLFGLTKFAVRLPSLALGSLTILLIWDIGQRLWPGNKRVSLWAALLAALSPGAIFYSGPAFPQGVAMFFFLLGCWFLLGQSRLLHIFSAVSFTAIMYTVKTAWLFIPAFLSGLIASLLIDKSKSFKNKTRKVVSLLIITLALSLPLMFSFFRLPGAVQSIGDNDLSLFKDIGIANSLNSFRGVQLKIGSNLLGRLFYNKAYWGVKLLENFLRHFNPRFIFAAGDGNSLHGFSNFSPFLLVFLPLFAYGFWHLGKQKNLTILSLIALFSFAAIPSALAGKSPDLSKFIFSFPLIIFVTAWGMEKLSLALKTIFGLLIFLNLIFVLGDIVGKEPFRTAAVWLPGFSEFAVKIETYIEGSDKAYFTDGFVPDPAPLLLFYWQYSPKKFLASRPNFSYKHWVHQFGQIQIGEPKKFEINPGDKAVLLMTEGEESQLSDRYGAVKSGSKESCYQRIPEVVYKDSKEAAIVMATVNPDNCLSANEGE